MFNGLASLVGGIFSITAGLLVAAIVIVAVKRSTRK